MFESSDLHVVVKDILIPIATSLVTLLAAVLIVRNETRRFFLALQEDKRKRLQLILSDAFFARDLLETMIGHNVHGNRSEAHEKEVAHVLESLFQRITSEPELANHLIHAVTFENSEKNNIFRLLIEAKTRALRDGRPLDPLVFFAVLTIIFLFDDSVGRLVTHDLLRNFADKGEIYNLLLVSKSTSPFKY